MSEPTPNIIQFDWPEYFDMLRQLGYAVFTDDVPTNQIIALTTGGIIPGMALGRMLGLRPAFLAAASYRPTGENTTIERQSSSIVFSRDLATTQPGLGDHAALIDDLDETGQTLNIGQKFMICRFGYCVTSLRTAVVWHKSTSTIVPNWSAQTIGPDETGIPPYIDQPHELEFSPTVLDRDILTPPHQHHQGIITIPWQSYFNDIKKLAQQVAARRHGINQIIALTMGGLIPGLALARILKLPLAILAVKIPPASAPESIVFSRDLIMTTPGLGSNVLIVDDRTWTPDTLERSIAWLKTQYGYCLSDRPRTAVLYRGPHGHSANYVVHNIPTLPNGQMPRLIQPMETEFPRLQKEATQ